MSACLCLMLPLCSWLLLFWWLVQLLLVLTTRCDFWRQRCPVNGSPDGVLCLLKGWRLISASYLIWTDAGVLFHCCALSKNLEAVFGVTASATLPYQVYNLAHWETMRVACNVNLPHKFARLPCSSQIQPSCRPICFSLTTFVSFLLALIEPWMVKRSRT